MAVQIAVLDPLPMFRQGVIAVLSAAGHDVEAPADVLAWVQDGLKAVVLLTLATDREWELLRMLCAPGALHVVIAVVEDDSGELGVRAVRAGARSVLSRGAAAETLRRTVDATLDGQAVLPLSVVQALVSGLVLKPELPISGEQLSWLRQLAGGSTVAQLAERAGYSERGMFRLLQSTYQALGVRSRLDAVIRAREQGWIRSNVDDQREA